MKKKFRAEKSLLYIVEYVADRRGLSHALRSSSTSSNDTVNRSRRTSRSTTSERTHGVDPGAYNAAHRNDTSDDVEHKRVIDNFVVKQKNF